MANMNNFKIDFLGLGTVKAATTWIFQCLMEHPEICSPSRKEIGFFLDEKYAHGLQWYADHFGVCDGDELKGEFTPTYLDSANVAERIKKHFPETKFIVSLRSPIERFCSTYYDAKSRGRRHATVDAYLDSRPEVDLQRGLYSKHLRRWFKLFPREQFLILIYDDIAKDPEAFIKRVYGFIGVDTAFIPPSLNKKQNISASNQVRFMSYHRWLYRTRGKLMNGSLNKWLVPFLKKLRLHRLAWYLYYLNERPSDKLKPVPKEDYPKPDTVRKLRNYYRSEISEMEKILDRSLDVWANVFN